MDKCQQCLDYHSDSDEGKRLCSALIALRAFRDTCEAYKGSRIDPALMLNVLNMGINGTARKEPKK